MDRKRKCPSKACYCAVLTGWLMVALFVFLTSSLLYLGPLLKSLRFRFTECRVENAFYTTQFICRCGSGCKSSYPCILVHVSLNVSDGQTWTLALYKDEVQQGEVVKEESEEWCSLKVCDSDSLVNLATVERFHENFGVRGHMMQCAYDPWDIKAGAVIRVRPITMAIFHALFWPFLGIIIGVTLCIIFCRKCRQEDVLKTETQSGTSKEAGDASLQLTKLEDGKAKNDTSTTTSNSTTSPDPGGTPQKVKMGRFKRNKSATSATNHKVPVLEKKLLKSKSLFS